MSVEIIINKSKWVGALKAATAKASYALANQIMTDSERFTPYSGGSIQSAGNLREARIDPPGGKSTDVYVVWDAVYAAYQWFGMRRDGSHQVHNYTTPGTGKQWVETARKSYGDNWMVIAQKEFNEGLK